MKKNIILLLILLLWASPAPAQQATADTPLAESLEEFEATLSGGYRAVTRERSSRAGEYEYLNPYAAGALDLEWDPLPQRFVLESSLINQKDYFGSFDYSYGDMVLLNLWMRDLYHNLDHYTLGPDDPATSLPSFTDKNPGDVYGIENRLRSASIRLKTPDFPFHVYASVQTVDREGMRQQRYLRGFTGGLDLVSQTRSIAWNTQEASVGVNSHLGYVEADYSHTEKTFTVEGDQALYDTYAAPAMTIPHNLVPELKSSSDTLRLHSTYSGRFVAAATYSDGKKKNEDSGAKVDYRNMAGDITLTPTASLSLIARYRHYDLSANNPDTVTLSGLGSTYRVRDALSSKRDLVTGIIRYRLTPRLAIKGEYQFDTTARNDWQSGGLSPLQIAPTQTGTGPDSWEVAHRTTKITGKGGLSYRILNRLTLRADYSSMQVTNPAYAADPDRVDAAKASLTWSPVQRVTTLVSYGGAREKRDNLSAPLAGGTRKADRDQAFGSLTILAGKRSSITASYLYYNNKNKETITYRDATGLFIMEDGVPYADKAEVFSLSATQALGEGVLFIAEGSRVFSSGRFRNDGSVADTTGIAEFSDLKVVEDVYSAGLEMQFSKTLSSEFRYQQRHYDDKIDNAQDGKVNTMLATVSVKW